MYINLQEHYKAIREENKRLRNQKQANKWIPASKPLEEVRDVLFQTVDGSQWKGRYDCKTWYTDRYDFDDFTDQTYFDEDENKVVAWMPLPPTYKERKTDETD